MPPVALGFGTEAAQTIRHCTVASLRAQDFPAGSIGPKGGGCLPFRGGNREERDDRPARRRGRSARR